MRTILAVVVGLFVGGLVNMGLILLGPQLFPLPEGVDPMDAESIAANIHLFSAGNFVMVWLAHALGTLSGAVLAGTIATTNKTRPCWFLGGFFLIGGVMVAMDIDAPLWFDAADLVGAYLPMAWLATKVVGRGDEPGAP